MDNSKQPAYPVHIIDGYGSSYHGILPNGQAAWSSDPGGLTKLERGSLMIAQGALVSKKEFDNDADFAKYCVNVANAVIEEANKPQEESAVVKMLRTVTERLEWTTQCASFADEDQETEILLKAAKGLLEKLISKP